MASIENQSAHLAVNLAVDPLVVDPQKQLRARLGEYLRACGGDPSALDGWQCLLVGQVGYQPAQHALTDTCSGAADRPIGQTTGCFISPDGKRFRSFDGVCKRLGLEVDSSMPSSLMPRPSTGAGVPPSSTSNLQARSTAGAVPLKKRKLGPSGKPVSWC